MTNQGRGPVKPEHQVLQGTLSPSVTGNTLPKRYREYRPQVLQGIPSPSVAGNTVLQV